MFAHIDVCIYVCVCLCECMYVCAMRAHVHAYMPLGPRGGVVHTASMSGALGKYAGCKVFRDVCFGKGMSVIEEFVIVYSQRPGNDLRMMVCLMIHESGWVSLEHLLLLWYPSNHIAIERIWHI